MNDKQTIIAMQKQTDLRDKVAIAAIQGFLANGNGPSNPWVDDGDYMPVVTDAFQVADEYLKQRDKPLEAGSAEMGDKVLIWSKKDKAYWKDGSNGYSPYLSHAGLFDRKKAATICPQLNNIIELEDAITTLQIECKMKK